MLRHILTADVARFLPAALPLCSSRAALMQTAQLAIACALRAQVQMCGTGKAEKLHCACDTAVARTRWHEELSWGSKRGLLRGREDTLCTKPEAEAKPLLAVWEPSVGETGRSPGVLYRGLLATMLQVAWQHLRGQGCLSGCCSCGTMCCLERLCLPDGWLSRHLRPLLKCIAMHDCMDLAARARRACSFMASIHGPESCASSIRHTFSCSI